MKKLFEIGIGIGVVCLVGLLLVAGRGLAQRLDLSYIYSSPDIGTGSFSTINSGGLMPAQTSQFEEYRQLGFPGDGQDKLFSRSLDWEGLRAGRYGGVHVECPAGGVDIPTIAQATDDNDPTQTAIVYYCDGDLTITGGTMPGDIGPRTVVAEGDITINGNILGPTSESPSNVSEVSTLAILAQGDIRSNLADWPPNTTHLFGAYFAQNKFNQNIKSFTTLVITGLLVAKELDLDQIAPGDPNTPDLKVIYDRRLVINPPPGLIDLVSIEPRIREIIPEPDL